MPHKSTQLAQTVVANHYLALIPLLPISLTGIFYYFGIRSRAERDLGGYAYCVVAIVLAAFTVFSVNEHWLRSALWPCLPTSNASCCATTPGACSAWTCR